MQWETCRHLCKGSLGKVPARKLVARTGFSTPQRCQICVRHVTHVAAVEPAAERAGQSQNSSSSSDSNGNSNKSSPNFRQQRSPVEQTRQQSSRTSNGSSRDTVNGERQAGNASTRRENTNRRAGKDTETSRRGEDSATNGAANGQRAKGYVRGTPGNAASKANAAVKQLRNSSSIQEVAEVLDKQDGEVALVVLTGVLEAVQRLHSPKSSEASPLPEELQSLLDRVVRMTAPFTQTPDVREHIRLFNRLEALDYRTTDADLFDTLLQSLDNLGRVLDLNKPVMVRVGRLWEPRVVPKAWLSKYPVARRILGMGVWKTAAAAREETQRRKATETEIVKKIFTVTSVDELTELSEEIMSLPLVSRGRLLVRAHQMLGKLLGSNVPRNAAGSLTSDFYEEWKTVAPEAVTDDVKALLQGWADQLPAVLRQQRRESFELSTGPVLWCWSTVGWWPSQQIVDEVVSHFSTENERTTLSVTTWKLAVGYYTAQGLSGLARMPSPPMDAVERALNQTHAHTTQVASMLMGYALSSIMGTCIHLNISKPLSWWEPLFLLHLERTSSPKVDQLQHYRAALKKLFLQWPAEWDAKLPLTKKLWEDKLSCEEICKPLEQIPAVVKAVLAADTYQQVVDTMEANWGEGHQEYVAAALRHINKIHSVRESTEPDAELAAVAPYVHKYLSYLATHIDQCFPRVVSLATGNLRALAAAEPELFAKSVEVLAQPAATFLLRHVHDFQEAEFINVVLFLKQAGVKWDDKTETEQIGRAVALLLNSMPDARARSCLPVVIDLGVTFDTVSQGRVLKHIMDRELYWTGFQTSVLQMAPSPDSSWDSAVLSFFSHLWGRSNSVDPKVMASFREAADVEGVMKLLHEQGDNPHHEYQAIAFRRIGLLYSTARSNRPLTAESADESASESSPSDLDSADADSEESTTGRMESLPLDDSARAAARKLARSLLSPESEGRAPTDEFETLRNVMSGCAHLGLENVSSPELLEKVEDPVGMLTGKMLKAVAHPSPVRAAPFCEILWSAATLGYKPDEQASNKIVGAFLGRVSQCEVWQLRSALRSLLKLGIKFSPAATKELLKALRINKARPNTTLLSLLKQLCPPDTPGLENRQTIPTGPLTPEVLTQVIRRASNLASVQALYTNHADALSLQQAALLLRKTVQVQLKAQRKNTGAAGTSPSSPAAAVNDGASRAAANAEATAQLCATLTARVYSGLDSCDMDVLQHFSYALARMDPSEASAALAPSGASLDELLPRLQGFFFAFVPDMSPGAFAETVWSLGRLGYAPDTTGLMVLGERLLALLPEFSAIQLRMLLVSFVGFRARTAPEVIEQLIIHVHEHHLDVPQRTLRDIMQSLESMCVEVRPEWNQKYALCGQYWGRMRSAWATTIADATLPELKALLDQPPADFAPSDLISIFSRLAELAPTTSQAAAASNRAGDDDGEDGSDEGAEGSTSGQDWPQLGPVLVDTVISRMRENLEAYRGWQIARVLQTAARLDLRPEEAWLDAALDHLMSQVSTLNRNTAASAMEALGRLGYYAGEHRLSALLNQLRTDVTTTNRPTRLTPLVAALVGAARVYYIPDSEWVAWFLKYSQGLLKTCSPPQLVELVRALARMNCKPEEEWLKSLLSAVEGAYAKMKPWDKARIVKSLEKIGGALPLQQDVAGSSEQPAAV